MTEQLHFHFSLSCIGEGNGNPLQCSWLENPRDGGAWWAAIYGVAQGRTWLKWLSSSSTFNYKYFSLLSPNFWAGEIPFLRRDNYLESLILMSQTYTLYHSVMSDSLRPHGPYSPWNSPGQNTGVGSHSLLQGIFPTQGWNPGLPHCRRILYQLGYQGSSKKWAKRNIRTAAMAKSCQKEHGTPTWCILL